MKRALVCALLFSAVIAYGDVKKPTTLKGVLLEQLKTTHNQKDWFVPINTALESVTADQAKWHDQSGNHSVGQLAYHLLFWNGRALERFKGEKSKKFSGDNEETFNDFDPKTWADTVHQLDAVMTEWEKAVEAADDKKVAEFASEIAHIGTHNAYHVGQIIYVRKLQGSWNAANGVK